MRLGCMHMTRKQPIKRIRAKGKSKPKRSRQSRSKIKVMLTVFFDYRDVVHYEFLAPGQIVNKEYYLSVMQCLRETIHKKRPELWDRQFLVFAPR